jgi:hypothetical protein
MASYKYVWADGQLELGNGFSRVHHFQLLEKMIADGRLPAGVMPQNYVGGDFSTDDYHDGKYDTVTIKWEGGQHPDVQELKYLIRSELDNYGRDQNAVARVMALREAADVEDTEPKYNFGFLNEPHDELYPCAWENEKLRPEAKKAILNHVLNAVEAEFTNPDEFIYFTVYGSGASYNWDEDGDFDVQMWVDFEKYQDSNNGQSLTQDDLISAVRRLTQEVNFPSFKELNLQTDDCEGRMLIQYYPKPGTGSKDENLASKPYACYDMEEDEWLQQPDKVGPQFYGEHFLMLLPKAEDVATQAETLIADLDRHIADWTFWAGMYSKYNDIKYKERYEDSKNKADQEREGVKNLFENVFQGRQEAYSPEGQGNQDERDLLQKLLEVWGIFQELKHFARLTFPWESQDLPLEEPEVDETEGDDETKAYTKEKVEHASTITGWSRVVKSAGKEDSPEHRNPGGWAGITQKAKRLLNSGAVSISNNETNHVTGVVQGDHGTYNTEIWRDDPNSGSITQWHCDCPWSDYSWGRTRKWKKYEGRPCAHTLALYWQSLKQPLDDQRPENQEEPQGQLFNPSDTLPQPAPSPFAQPVNPLVEPVTPNVPGHPNPGIIPAPVLPATPVGQPSTIPPSPLPPPGTVMPQPLQGPPPEEAPVGPPAPAAPPEPSHLKGVGEVGPLEFPGSFSNVRVSFFNNGDAVRAKQPLYGTDHEGTQYIIPQNMAGEVIYSDEAETIAIFTINSGPLGPHLVRVEDDTQNFYPDPRANPFIRKRR